MVQINSILISPKVIHYCKKRNLTNQLKKALTFLKSGNTKSISLKLLAPKHTGIYQFRINRQFRVTGKIVDGVYYINTAHNHQN